METIIVCGVVIFLIGILTEYKISKYKKTEEFLRTYIRELEDRNIESIELELETLTSLAVYSKIAHDLLGEDLDEIYSLEMQELREECNFE